jgi:aldose 1-epimerase
VRTPSGEQLAIASGDQAAVITEVGASLRGYEVGRTAVLDGYADDEIASSGRGQVLAPWPNRLEDGSYLFEGLTGNAALDEPDRRNAIHGLVRWLRWAVTSRHDDAVALACDLVPQPAYPFGLRLGIMYRLGADGLTVTATAECTGDRPLPFGLGFHPYLTVGTELVDSVVLHVPADRRLEVDGRALPTGEVEVAGTPYDFRTPREIGALQLDDCFCLTDAGGASVTDPATGRSVVLWAGPEFPYLMAYTGDTLGDPARRRRSVALEPMTCPPNALRSGVGLVRLGPGDEWTGTWGIRPGGTG